MTGRATGRTGEIRVIGGHRLPNQGASQPQPAALLVLPDLKSTSPAADLLAAAAARPDWPDTLLKQAHSAYVAARAKCDGSDRQDGQRRDLDWAIADAKWREFGNLFGAHLRFDVGALPPAKQRALMLQRLRALLEALEYFTAWQPRPSGFQPLQPVPTAVHAHRVTAQHTAGPHPLEPTLKPVDAFDPHAA